jgi:hypothetical protein
VIGQVTGVLAELDDLYDDGDPALGERCLRRGAEPVGQQPARRRPAQSGGDDDERAGAGLIGIFPS